MSNQHHDDEPDVIRRTSKGSSKPNFHFKTSEQPQQSGNKLRNTIRASKRRIIQQILVKLRQAEVSDDEEYQTLRTRQDDLYNQVAALMSQIKGFASTLIAFAHGASTIGDTALTISTPTSQSMATRRKSVVHSTGTLVFDTEFPKTMHKLENSARELNSTILGTLVKRLEKKLDSLMTLKKEMEDRENLKLDFDSAVRKLRKAKSSDKPEDVTRRELKLHAARTALTTATDAIVKQFLQYEQARNTFIASEVHQFRELQSTFFAVCVASFQTPQPAFNLDEDEDVNQ